MTHVGLFEGIGGFSLAARWMGWKTIAWCEWNEFGQRVLRHHFPEAQGHGDITQTDFTVYRGKCDILTGGFPCQPYSLAGKRLGKEDDRHLWPQMLRAVREIQPRWVVGENVFGIVNWNGGLVFNEVQADLEAEGYEVQAYVLPACAINAPHRRDRVWFVAHRNDTRNATLRSGTNGNWQAQSSEWEESQHECSGLGNKEPATDTSYPGLLGRQLNGASDTERQKRGQQSSGSTTEFYKIGNWHQFPTQSPVCSRNDGLPARLDGITFPKWRAESIKAYGNAIVPHVAYQIYQAIEQYEIQQIG